MKPLVIIGCGGFGREVHDVVDAINAIEPTWKMLGYVDDNPGAEDLKLIHARGFAVLGGVDWFVTDDIAADFVIGIGTGEARAAIDHSLTVTGRRAAALVHPQATLGHDVSVGAGSVICAGVRATTNIRIGRHVHLNLNVTIGHDAVLEDYVTVNPLAAVSGRVHVGAGSVLGTCSTVLQNLIVGETSVVGAGSCVVRNVPAFSVVKGVPAR